MGDLGLIPGLGRFPWRRARLPPILAWEIPWTEEWRVTVNRVRKSWTPLRDFHLLPWCELLLSLIRQVLAQYTPVLGPCSLRHSAILPFECPLCRKRYLLSFSLQLRCPFHSPSFNFFSPPGQRVIGSWEWLQASRPLPADHLALPRSFPSYSLWGRDSRARARGRWLRPGLGFLRGLWNFLETDWAVWAACSLEQSEQGCMAGCSFEPSPFPRLVVLKL